MMANNNLVGGWAAYPAEKWWSSSVGMMNFPTERKSEIHVPNHQPDVAFKTSDVVLATGHVHLALHNTI